MMFRTSILSAFLIVSFSQLFSQGIKLGIPEIEYFNRRVYNGGTQNWKITQSREDLIYFANNDGLLEFDGVNWMVYRDMGSFVVRSIKAVEDRIYAGSYNELGFYSYNDHHQLKYHSLVVPQIKNLEDFWSIHQWQNHIVFHSEKALCLFQNDQFIAVIPAVSRFTSCFQVNDMLLVHDEMEGLMEVRGQKAYPVSGGKIFAGKSIGTVLAASDDQILIGTMYDGLYIWDMQTIRKWDVPANQLLMKADIFCGTRYQSDYFVLGTIQSGMVIIDKNGRVVMVIDKDKGLNNNTLLSVFVDREGNLWGGLDNGIVKVNFNSGISFLQGYFNMGTGYAMSLFRGNYYFGTNQALYKISESSFKDPLKDRAHFEKVTESAGQVWSLYSDEDELLCGHHLGVFRIVGDKAQRITPANINGVWLFKTVSHNPDILLAGTYNGLILLEKKHQQWQFKSKVEGFNESSRFLEWEKGGNLWMSHGYKGVYQLSLSDDCSKITRVQTFLPDSFPDNSGPLVVTRIKGDCLFSGASGLYSIDPDHGKPVRDHRFDIYFEKGQYPLRFIEDQYQNVWFFYTGKVGVLRYLEDGSYRKIEHPFVSLENKLVNSFESLMILDKENALFGVEDGFAHYWLSDRKEFNIPFNVHIRSFKGDGDSAFYALNQNDEEGRIQKVIPHYPFGNNSFEFHYAAAFYECGDIKYSTYLSNFDQHPSEWSSASVRQFTKIPEGNYSFQVRAKNRYNVVSAPIQFDFVVNPPWYRTIYAKLGYLILLISMAVILIYAINKRIEFNRQKEILKQQQRFREKEEKLMNDALLAEKEMIRIRSEKLKDEMVFKEKELANSAMNMIQKNEFLNQIKFTLKKVSTLQDKDEIDRKIVSLMKRIDKDIDSESYWRVFETNLEQVHEDFLKRLTGKHPELTPRELKLAAYIRMGMASKEIAVLMNISTRAVENNRYKLRQKLAIGQGDNLTAYIHSI